MAGIRDWWAIGPLRRMIVFQSAFYTASHLVLAEPLSSLTDPARIISTAVGGTVAGVLGTWLLVHRAQSLDFERLGPLPEPPLAVTMAALSLGEMPTDPTYDHSLLVVIERRRSVGRPPVAERVIVLLVVAIAPAVWAWAADAPRWLFLDVMLALAVGMSIWQAPRAAARLDRLEAELRGRSGSPALQSF